MLFIRIFDAISMIHKDLLIAILISESKQLSLHRSQLKRGLFYLFSFSSSVDLDQFHKMLPTASLQSQHQMEQVNPRTNSAPALEKLVGV